MSAATQTELALDDGQQVVERGAQLVEAGRLLVAVAYAVDRGQQLEQGGHEDRSVMVAPAGSRSASSAGATSSPVPVHRASRARIGSWTGTAGAEPLLSVTGYSAAMAVSTTAGHRQDHRDRLGCTHGITEGAPIEAEGDGEGGAHALDDRGSLQPWVDEDVRGETDEDAAAAGDLERDAGVARGVERASRRLATVWFGTSAPPGPATDTWTSRRSPRHRCVARALPMPANARAKSS